MSALLPDTHAIVWYLLQSERLSSSALDRIEKVIAQGDSIYISSISLAELVYLVEKGKVPEIALERLVVALEDAQSEIACIPFDFRIAQALRRIPRDRVADMPDRIIAATALHLGIPLITRDRMIRAAGLDSVW